MPSFIFKLKYPTVKFRSFLCSTTISGGWSNHSYSQLQSVWPTESQWGRKTATKHERRVTKLIQHATVSNLQMILWQLVILLKCWHRHRESMPIAQLLHNIDLLLPKWKTPFLVCAASCNQFRNACINCPLMKCSWSSNCNSWSGARPIACECSNRLLDCWCISERLGREPSNRRTCGAQQQPYSVAKKSPCTTVVSILVDDLLRLNCAARRAVSYCITVANFLSLSLTLYSSSNNGACIQLQSFTHVSLYSVLYAIK